MTEVKLNATGRFTLMDRLEEGDPTREKIADHGIMEPIDFDQKELGFLVAVADSIRSTDVHWLNTRMRLKEAFGR